MSFLPSRRRPMRLAATSPPNGLHSSRPGRRWLDFESLEIRVLLALLSPSEVRHAYGIDQIMYGSTVGNGAGQTIAIIDPGDDHAFVDSTAANFNTSDLYHFDHEPSVNLPDPPSFRVIGETGGARPSYIGIATATETGTLVTVTTTSPHGLSTGNNVTIAEAGVAGYNGGYKVASVPNPTTFTATSTATTPPTGLPNSTGGTINNPVNTAETALDVEWSHAMAPAANIVLVELNTFSDGDIATGVNTAASIGASVVSMSFIGGEFPGETGGSTTSYDDGLFTAPGVCYFTGSGDNGGAFTPGSNPGYPSVSPNVLSVGATNLNLNPDGSYQSETGWSNPPMIGGNAGGSGGGISVYETQPAFQQGTVTKVTQSTTSRTTPDVSFLGGSLTPVHIYDSLGGGDYGVAGTSLSSPCWAGLIAIADQGLVLGGQPLLDSHPALQTKLYDLPLSDFHDITSGNNGFAAGPGYDVVTGIGTPVANLLIPDLVGTSIDYTVPTAGSPHQLVLRKDGANVELLDNGVVVATQPVSTISDVNITDPNSSNDSLTVDYAFDGIFAAQVDFDHTVSSGYDTVTVNAPNGPSNTISVNENPDVIGAGSIIVDGATQTINFQTASEVDVNAGSGGDTITLNGQGGKSGLSKVNVMGGAGNDTLIVDSSNGLFATPTNNSAGIFFNGGGGFNELVLQQTNGATQTSDVYSPGPNPGEGTDVITGPTSATQTVFFQNLAPVIDLVAALTFTVNGTPANNAINYTTGAVATNGKITIDNLESIEFSNKVALTINALAGSDKINLNNPTVPTGLTSITVNGGDPTASDKLIVNGIAGTIDDFLIQPTGVGAGTVGNDTDPAFVPVAFTGIESLVIVGQAADTDSLRVGDTANDDTVTYTPGATVDAGSITGYSNTSFAYVPITFSGIAGFVMPISIIGAQLGNDKLIIDGSTGGSTFDFSGDGGASFPGFSSIVVDGHAPIFYSPTTLAMNGVVLKALGGNNTFNLAAATTENTASLAVPIHVVGDGPGDVLNFTANAAASTTVDYGLARIASTGANTATFSAVGTINVAAGGGSLLVNGTAGDDNFAYTPLSTATDSGTVTLDGPAPVLNFKGVGAAGKFTIDPLGGTNSVTVDRPAAVASILASGGPTPVVQVSTSAGLTQALTLVPAHTQTLVIAGGLGSDTLTVNSSAGAFPIPIIYNGGGGGNSLELKDTVNTATSDIYSPGPAVGAGSSVIAIGGVTQTVNFTNLSPVFDFVAGPLTVNANNAINYAVGSSPTVSPSLTWGEVSVDNLEPINFINKASLTINALAGSDEISLNNPNVPTGLTGITVSGGDPTASDKLIVNGTAAQETITYMPDVTPVANNTVAITALPTVHFSGIENLVINGQGGNDTLKVVTPAGPDTVTLTPGAAADSGDITVTNTTGGTVNASATPLSFTNLGATGNLMLLDGTGGASTDTFVYNGTPANDTFTVAATGAVTLNTQIAVNTPGVAKLVLDGLGGTDTFNLFAPLPATLASTTIEADAVVNLAGYGTPIGVTLGGTAQQVTGGGLGVVNLPATATVNVTNGAGAVTVSGTAGLPNALVVTPTGLNSAQIQDNGPALLLNVTTTGALTVQGAGGPLDSVTINGTPGNDTMQLSGGPLAPQVAFLPTGSLKTINLSAGNTAALILATGAGSDSVIVDSTAGPFTIPVTYDGGSGATDTLTLQQNAGNPAPTSDTYAPGPVAGSGSSTLVFAAGTEAINFSNLKPVTDLVPGPLVVNGNGSNNAINYTAAPIAGQGLVSVDNFEPLTFSNKVSLALNGLGGDDTITVNNPTTPTGLMAITIDGGVGNNTLVVNANNQPVVSTNVTGAAVGPIMSAVPVAVDYTNIGHVSVINATDALTGTAIPFTATLGAAFNNVPVASFKFTDPGVPPTVLFGRASDFVASIDWGDGTVASPDVTGGTIVALGTNGFQVLGSHTYTTPSPTGTYTVNVVVTDTGSLRSFTPAGGVPVTIQDNAGATTAPNPIASTATIADALLSPLGATIYGVEGAAIPSKTILATFTDANPSAVAADFLSNGGSVSVNWGDGSPVETNGPGSTLNVVKVGTTPNGAIFEVQGGHTYVEEGSYPVLVTIVSRYGSQTVATSNAVVADAALSALPGQSITTTEATTFPIPLLAPPIFNGVVATFKDANPGATLGDFTATIDWGDGTPVTTGTVQLGIGSLFTVSGSHSYADSGPTGTYTIQVHIVDVGGSTLTVPVTANVNDIPMSLTGQLNPLSDSGKSHTDAITNVPRPNFYGVTQPYANVTLFANGIQVGQAEAASDGYWTITSNALADATYAITATAVDQFGLTKTTSPVTIVPSLVIDTVGPRVTAASYNRLTDTATFTFEDLQADGVTPGSGLLVQSLSDAANYSLNRVHARPAGTFIVTSINVTPGSEDVTVVFNNGTAIKGGYFQVIARAESALLASGIQDVAGNALDGEYYGQASSSGNGVRGGDFVANFKNIHQGTPGYGYSGAVTIIGYPHPNDPPAKFKPTTGKKAPVKVVVGKTPFANRHTVTPKVTHKATTPVKVALPTTAFLLAPI